jgi:hypothetical protein
VLTFVTQSAKSFLVSDEPLLEPTIAGKERVSCHGGPPPARQALDE